MLKRILILAALALVLSVPVALADTGAPGLGQTTQPQTTQPGAAAPSSARSAGRRGRGRRGGGRIAQRLMRLNGRIVRATAVFHARCESGKADPAKCTAVAQRLVPVLKKVDDRISTLIGKIQDRCNGSTGQAAPSTGQAAPSTGQTAPKGCQRVDRLVQRLGKLQTRVQTLEQKLQDWLANPPTGTGTASTSGGDGLAPLASLGNALAGARNAASASGV